MSMQCSRSYLPVFSLPFLQSIFLQIHTFAHFRPQGQSPDNKQMEEGLQWYWEHEGELQETDREPRANNRSRAIPNPGLRLLGPRNDEKLAVGCP